MKKIILYSLMIISFTLLTFNTSTYYATTSATGNCIVDSADPTKATCKPGYNVSGSTSNKSEVSSVIVQPITVTIIEGTDLTDIKPIINISVDGKNQGFTNTYPIQNLGSIVGSYSTSATVELTCPQGMNLIDDVCAVPKPNEEQPATTDQGDSLVLPNSKQELNPSGVIKDSQARMTIIISIIIVLLCLGGSIFLAIIILRTLGLMDKKNKPKKKDKNSVNQKNDADLVTKNKEIEFKTKITKYEYNNLLDLVQQKQYKKLNQTNWYFDTKTFNNINNKIVTRIRKENNSLELTIKSKTDEGIMEYSVPLTTDKFKEIKDTRQINLKKFKLDQYSTEPNLTYITKLDNLRYQYQDGEALICLDYSKYNGEECYELEIEYTSYEKGRLFFNNFLLDNEITYNPINTKTTRAFNSIKQKDFL